jgi:hypothetical protein
MATPCLRAVYDLVQIIASPKSYSNFPRHHAVARTAVRVPNSLCPFVQDHWHGHMISLLPCLCPSERGFRDATLNETTTPLGSVHELPMVHLTTLFAQMWNMFIGQPNQGWQCTHTCIKLTWATHKLLLLRPNLCELFLCLITYYFFCVLIFCIYLIAVTIWFIICLFHGLFHCSMNYVFLLFHVTCSLVTFNDLHLRFPRTVFNFQVSLCALITERADHTRSGNFHLVRLNANSAF